MGPPHWLRPLSLPPPPGPVSSPRCHQTRLQSQPREGSQRSASEASGEAGNSAAPARRPAPSSGPAPRWKAATAVAGQRRGKSLPGSLSPPGSSRAPHPRALCGSRGPSGRALRRRCRWARSGGRGGWGGIGAGSAGLGDPHCWTLVCRLAPLRSFLAATVPVVALSNPTLTWGKKKEKALTDKVLCSRPNGAGVQGLKRV